jgi:hypothetical protein
MNKQEEKHTKPGNKRREKKRLKSQQTITLEIAELTLGSAKMRNQET